MRGAFVFAVLVACGDATNAAPSRAVVDGRFESSSTAACSIAGSQILFGQFRASDQVPLKDGSTGEKGVNYVTCYVVDKGGDKFDVEASMKNGERLVFAIKGTFSKTTDTKGFAVESASLGNGQVGSDYAALTEADGKCSVVYATKDQNVSSGRVWGQVTCPGATKDPTDGGRDVGSCVTTTQFLFEDCATAR